MALYSIISRKIMNPVTISHNTDLVLVLSLSQQHTKATTDNYRQTRRIPRKLNDFVLNAF